MDYTPKSKHILTFSGNSYWANCKYCVSQQLIVSKNHMSSVAIKELLQLLKTKPSESLVTPEFEGPYGFKHSTEIQFKH